MHVFDDIHDYTPQQVIARTVATLCVKLISWAMRYNESNMTPLLSSERLQQYKSPLASILHNLQNDYVWFENEIQYELQYIFLLKRRTLTNEYCFTINRYGIRPLILILCMSTPIITSYIMYDNTEDVVTKCHSHPGYAWIVNQASPSSGSLESSLSDVTGLRQDIHHHITITTANI